MLFKLLLLFTLVPLAEIWVLIEAGGIVGTWPAIFLVASTGFVGFLLAKSQGFIVLDRIRRELEEGALPESSFLTGPVY